MFFESKLEAECVFPDLFIEKPNQFPFGPSTDPWIFNEMIGDFLEDKEDVPFKSVYQVWEPMDIKMGFIDQDYNEKPQKDDYLELDDKCKEDYESFWENLMKEDLNQKDSPVEIGAPNFEEIIKIKAESNILDFKPEKIQGNNKAYCILKPKDEIGMKDEDNLTEDEFVEDLNKSSEDTDNPKKQRKDVSYKTILRKCRKYYQQRFNSHTGFLRNKKKEPCSFYRDCILKFIEEWVPIKTNLNISFHMGALLYPQEMIKRIESFVYPNGIKNFTPKKVVKRKVDTHKQQVEKLHSILYKFTHEKLEKFILVPELAAIFLNYIEQAGEKDQQDEEFIHHMKDLTKRCRKSIGKSRKTKSIVTLFD